MRVKQTVQAKIKPPSRIQIASRPKNQTANTSKIENTKRILMTKLDDILMQYKGVDQLIPEIEKSISTLPQSEITNEPLSAKPPSVHVSEKQLPKVKPKKAPAAPRKVSTKDKFQQIKDSTFMTGAGLTKKKKKRKNKFIAKTEKEIDDIIKNIDDIDTMMNDSKDQELLEGSPEFREKMEKDMKEFKALVAEIDGYKQELDEEFDEIKYLIKLADTTHGLIDRHKNVIGSIFKGAGLKTKTQMYGGQMRERSMPNKKIKMPDDNIYQEESDDEDEDEDEFGTAEIGKVFNKLKKINQIKDNIGNTQDDFLNYHEKLKETCRRAQSAQRPSGTNNQKNK